ncbi:MAG: 6-phosphogluconolactonase [Terrimicrobiaceae bacterium]|nr:6-phosphogluconolactonase [Terrimicrobiaceae bacterium]
MTPSIVHTQDFVAEAAAFIRSRAEEAVAERGIFRVALSGGNTPRPVYRALAGMETDWSKWEVTFGDERCVPPESDQSNFRMAKESLFDHAPIPDENILRMRGEDEPDVAATAYEQALLAREAAYRHDLILLGMGDDGHTASLFPGTAALEERERWVVANFVPKFSTHRLTFTYRLLNAARHVCFLVNSTGKESVLEEVFSGRSSYPSAAVQPTDGDVTWLLGRGL